jgi:hypothetical protein
MSATENDTNKSSYGNYQLFEDSPFYIPEYTERKKYKSSYHKEYESIPYSDTEPRKDYQEVRLRVEDLETLISATKKIMETSAKEIIEAQKKEISDTRNEVLKGGCEEFCVNEFDCV